MENKALDLFNGSVLIKPIKVDDSPIYTPITVQHQFIDGYVVDVANGLGDVCVGDKVLIDRGGITELFIRNELFYIININNIISIYYGTRTESISC